MVLAFAFRCSSTSVEFDRARITTQQELEFDEAPLG
jgi:hypothetical protein